MQDSAKNKKMMAIGPAAKYLGVSRDTLRRWEKAGRLKALRSPTNRRYYTKEILDAAMADKKGQTIKVETPSMGTIKPESKRTSKIGKKGRLFLFGAISFILATLLALLLQYFVLK